MTKQERAAYSELAFLSDLIIESIENIEGLKKDKRMKKTKLFIEYQSNLESVKEFAEKINEIVFSDPDVRNGVVFQEATNKIQTIVRKAIL